MEENPPTERRSTPRARAPRPAFSAPQQPEKADKPAERAPRRAAKAAPPVTFQPPGAEDHPGEGSANRPSGTRRRPVPAQPTNEPAAPTPGNQPAPGGRPQSSSQTEPGNRTEPGSPAQAGRPSKARPPKAAPQPAPARPVESNDAAVPARPAKAAAKKAAPAKRAPRKAAKTPPPALQPAESQPAATTPVDATPAEPEPVAAEPVAAKAGEPAETQTGSGIEANPQRQPQKRTDPWAQLIADPAHAPELLALAAVQTIGPRAKAWAAQTRAAYPTADDAALARLATRQFTRFGGVASVFGAIAGSYAPAALLAGAALTHAELVLHLAAAYRQDPTDPQRAAEILVIARVHATKEEAEAALASARRPAYDESVSLTEAIVRLGRLIAARSGGSWTAARLVNRYFPGTSLLTAVLSSTASAQGAAARAAAFYRSQVSSESGSSV